MHQSGALACRDFYDRVAPAYDRLYAHSATMTRRQADWLARACPAGRLLDLGCGTGRMLLPLAEAGFRPVGLDFSTVMLAAARQAAPGMDLVLADARRPLPFADDSFATVISLHATLAHVVRPEDLRALGSEIHRVLAPGGALVIELPHPELFPPQRQPRAWRTFTEGLSCRLLDQDLEEMRLDDLGGVSTLVRVHRVENLPDWLGAFGSIRLHPGFSGGSFKRGKGELMVIWARK